jgi:hypothetical protein
MQRAILMTSVHFHLRLAVMRRHVVRRITIHPDGLTRQGVPKVRRRGVKTRQDVTEDRVRR